LNFQAGQRALMTVMSFDDLDINPKIPVRLPVLQEEVNGRVIC